MIVLHSNEQKNAGYNSTPQAPEPRGVQFYPSEGYDSTPLEGYDYTPKKEIKKNIKKDRYNNISARITKIVVQGSVQSTSFQSMKIRLWGRVLYQNQKNLMVENRPP